MTAPWLAGVDLLRAFSVARRARFLGWGTEEDEPRMRALVARIREIRCDVALANDTAAGA